MVSGRVLVLQHLHPVHAGGVRGNPRAAAATQHVRDSQDGQQAVRHSGESEWSVDTTAKLYILYWRRSASECNLVGLSKIE